MSRRFCETWDVHDLQLVIFVIPSAVSSREESALLDQRIITALLYH